MKFILFLVMKTRHIDRKTRKLNLNTEIYSLTFSHTEREMKWQHTKNMETINKFKKSWMHSENSITLLSNWQAHKITNVFFLFVNIFMFLFSFLFKFLFRTQLIINISLNNEYRRSECRHVWILSFYSWISIKSRKFLQNPCNGMSQHDSCIQSSYRYCSPLTAWQHVRNDKLKI